MKKRFLIIAALIGLLISCSDPANGHHDDINNPEPNPIPNPNPNPNPNPIPNPEPNQNTVIVFNNAHGICTAVVYDDYRRENKIAEVPAGASSPDIEWPPGTSVPFYFSYRVNLKGINGFTLNYTPREVGKDQTAVRIDANTKTTINIPKLDETVSSPDDLLSNYSYILIQNNSSFSIELLRGDSAIRPDDQDDQSNTLINSEERAQYTINAGAASNYRLFVGADYVNFSGSLVSFEAGCVYSFIFDNGIISLVSEVEIKLENVARVSVNIPETPGAPVVKAGNGLLTVNWTKVEGADSYEVYRSTSQNPPALPEKTVPGEVTVLTGLINKTEYYVWVKAVNGNGASDFSPRSRGIPWPENEGPATPGRPIIIPGINQLTVNWEETGGASSYEVYINTTTTTPSSAAVTTEKTSTVINNLENGVTYYIWVRAVNNGRKSGYSPVEAGSPKIPTAAPTAPARPVLVADNKKLAVSWQAVELAASYEVWYGTSSNSAQAQQFGGDVTGGVTETIITGLTNETTYYVWIKAKNTVGTSGFSLPANARPSAFAVLPETPALPTVISGNKELSVSWQAVEGALLYEVWTGATSNSANAVKHGADITGTSVRLTDLNNGTTYYIWIRAKNNIGTSGFSLQASGIPSASSVPPSDPQTAPIVTAGNRELELSWQAVEGASAYELWAGTTPNPTSATKHNDVSALSGTVTELTNETAYYVWIKAKNNAGTSGFSPMASGTPSAFAVIPQVLAAPSIVSGNGQISISWQAIEGTLAYEIWLGTSNNTALAAKNGDDESASLSRTISGLSNGTTYYIWLKAKNNIGTSGFSPVASGKPIGNMGTVTVSPGGGRELVLSWQAVAGADQYEVYYSASSSMPASPAQTVSVTTAIVGGLINGTTNYVWVRPKNSNGTGSISVSANGIPMGSIGTVTLVSGNGQLLLSWNSVAGANQYEVYHSTSNTIPSNPSQTVSATTATISGLANGTVYYVWVRPKNASGSGNASTIISGKPLGTPSTPSVSSGLERLLVTWTSVAGADQYEVYYGTSSPPEILWATTSGTEATVTGLTVGATYYVCLRARNASGVSEYGLSASGVPDGPGFYRNGGAERIGNQNLSAALSYISTNAVNGDDYLIILGADETVSPATLSYSSRTVGITLRGFGSERTVSLGSNGNMFTVNAGVTLTLDENITLSGRNANTGSLVNVASNGNFIMNGGTISGNTKSDAASPATGGGGVYVNNGNFIMNGGTISGNTASHTFMGLSGGGVSVGNGNFTMNGGTISGNTLSNSSSTAQGGGVSVGSGTFIMNGGAISENTVDSSSSSPAQGGGVYVGSGAFTMIDGTISGNTASSSTSSSSGGGVYVGDGYFSMNGGAISGNTASSSTSGSSGGGVFINRISGSNGTFTMNGGTISGNTANTGGGIYVNGTFTMYGGTISGNTATGSSNSYGGGVWVYRLGSFIKQPRGSTNSGIIYGSEAVGNDANGVPLRNTASSGHAVYCDASSSVRMRNTTANQTDQITASTGRGLSASGNPPYGQ
jgi:fibronectin type 3 domain-containing protein